MVMKLSHRGAPPSRRPHSLSSGRGLREATDTTTRFGNSVCSVLYRVSTVMSVTISEDPTGQVEPVGLGRNATSISTGVLWQARGVPAPWDGR